MSKRAALLAFSCAALAGCRGAQSALDPAADKASKISGEWWIFLAVLGVIWGLVVAAMLMGIWRGGEDQEPTPLPPPLPMEPAPERRLTTWVTGSVAATVIILLGLLFFDYFTVRAVSKPAPPDALVIKITGHQWWWEVQYTGGTASELMKTANELHIPIGRPVKFELESVDVIHSFWVPSLHGKKDLIPGHPTSTWFIPQRAGTFMGNCGEFCGFQHAHMRLMVTAEPPEQFAKWLEAQRSAAPEPTNDQQRRGREIFLKTTCIMCHTIQGTNARSNVGPDLTHVASRAWLGAGALPNARGFLAGWILDPQIHKPGVHMPQHTFSGEELNALLDYLEALK